MVWKSALTSVFRKQCRILKGAVLLKVVDMRAYSWAFSAWRGVRESYRQQVRAGVFISAIVNKAVRLMVAAYYHEWKGLTRSNIRLRTQVLKQKKRIQHKILGHCVFTWMHRSHCEETNEVRQETHHLLIKMRVLQSLSRVTKIITRLRLRSIYFKLLKSWNDWLDFVREEQRLRLQLPNYSGEVVLKDGEMRQYRFSYIYPFSILFIKPHIFSQKQFDVP